MPCRTYSPQHHVRSTCSQQYARHTLPVKGTHKAPSRGAEGNALQGLAHQSRFSSTTVAHAATTRPARPIHSARVPATPTPSLGSRAASTRAVLLVITIRPLVASRNRLERASSFLSPASCVKGGTTQTPPPTSHSATCTVISHHRHKVNAIVIIESAQF